MNSERIDYLSVWIAGLGLLIYSIIITVLTGDIGFEGDDWWVLNVPYWNSFPSSFFVYAKEFLRPIEGVYWISMFEIFGFNRIAFHLFSLLLLAASSILMGIALTRTFPGNRVFIVLSILISFFLPMVSSLTYIVFTDNSRLCSLLFWASVVFYQHWVAKGSPWQGLLTPSIIYILSFLTYESCSLLIFVIPLLLLPIYYRMENRLPVRSFLIRLCVGILGVFSFAMFLRFAFLHGGAVAHNHFLPPLSLFFSYLGLLPFYLAAPFTSFVNDFTSQLIGILFALCVATFVHFLWRQSSKSEPELFIIWKKKWYIIFLGVSIFILGMLPYQLAGYGIVVPTITETLMAKAGLMPDGSTKWFGFHAISRIYSSGSYGLAIIFAAILTTWNHLREYKLFTGITATAIGFMAAFHAGLSIDWKEAAQIRNDLVRSLITQVPNVTPGTNFVFLDLECYHKRAAVFRGWIGLQCLMKMLYNDQTITGWYLHSHAWRWPNVRNPRAVVSSEGFWSRGMKDPAPASSLVILKRSDRSLTILDCISANDGQAPTGISWEGATTVHSHTERIVAWANTERDLRKVRNAWTTGLISTLQLAKISLPLPLRRLKPNRVIGINLKSGSKYLRVGLGRIMLK